MTTTTTDDDKLTITMSERRPLKIVKKHWPLIASAEWHDGEVQCQANNERYIRVREHRNGRRIVYGFQCAGNGGQHRGTRNPEGGFLVEPTSTVRNDDVTLRQVPDEEGTIRAIRRIGGILGDEDLAAECIADLPAEDLS